MSHAPVSSVPELLTALASEAMEIVYACDTYSATPPDLATVIGEIFDLVGWLEACASTLDVSSLSSLWQAIETAASVHKTKCADRGLTPLVITYEHLQRVNRRLSWQHIRRVVSTPLFPLTERKPLS